MQMKSLACRVRWGLALVLALGVWLLIVGAVIASSPLGTGFTYQGFLKDDGSPANGAYDLEFRLFDAATDGAQVGTLVAHDDVSVTNGLFVVQLDFGTDAFNGDARCLEIGVSTDRATISPTLLAPRQALTAAPYALHAASTGALQGYPVTGAAPSDGQALVWSEGAWQAQAITGTVGVTAGTGLTLNTGLMSLLPAYQLPQMCGNGQVAKWNSSTWECAADSDTMYTAGLGLHLTANQFVVASDTVQARVSGTCGAGYAVRTVNQDGTVVCEPIPATFSGWALTGNAGTDPAANFIGTSDNVTFTVRANNAPVLQFIPNAASPNLIGGYGGNWLTPGVFGATIDGGGQSGNLNRVTDHFGVIGGGQNNQAGNNDDDLGNAHFVTIAGGWNNTASGESSTVGGGYHHTAGGSYATISGGANHIANGYASTVGGGFDNTAQGNYSFAAGRRAQALHQGAFVWADSTATDYTSTVTNQFAVRATGGVTFNTGSAPVQINGNLGLGIADPTERLAVRGNARVLGYDDPVARGFITTTTPHAPRAVTVAGQYAYVVSESGDSLSIFDISNPDAITARGVITTGLSVARAVAVAGDYAYVASYNNKRLVVFDVSDPDNIVWIGDTYVYGPMAVTVSGRYAYVVKYNNYLVIFDVSDPANPIAVGTINSNMNIPTSVFVSGRYAYVTNYYSPYLSIFDISDPGNIVPHGSTDTSLHVPYAVVVSGRYAYVASWWNGRLVAFDISDPDNPIYLDDINTNLGGAYSVAVAGDYAYVTSRNNDGLAVFDVSDPTNLIARGFTTANLDDPQSVFVAGRYAYVASAANNRLAVFDLNHLEAPTADIGSLHTGGLHVGESAIVGNNLIVQDGLNVGGDALIGGDVSVQGNLFAHVSVTTLTGSATLVTTQSGIVLVDNAAAATITLPDAASSKGLTFTIKRLTANAVTVASAGGTMDGTATQALAAQYDFITVISDGMNWYITGR